MVIGSTATESAANNIGTSDPGAIYNLAGQEVAPSTAALFNTASVALLNPIDIDQNGTPCCGLVWTGTAPDGSIGAALGVPNAYMGQSGSLGPAYLAIGQGSASGPPGNFYAISSPITVGAGTPEPTTIGLSALGGAILLLAVRRKRPHANN